MVWSMANRACTIWPTALLCVAGVCVTPASAQYPRLSADVQREAARKMADADRRSDEAWRRALPVVKEWESRGKPYIPWAAKPDDLPQAPIPAFPGAQGGGMYSFGGRGGKVFVVTNLNDSGPGSFREACEAGGPRIVVFNLAGIIRLKDRIRIRAHLERVEQKLRGADTSHLTPEQRAARELALDRLRAYRIAGEFPHGYDGQPSARIPAKMR